MQRRNQVAERDATVHKPSGQTTLAWGELDSPICLEDLEHERFAPMPFELRNAAPLPVLGIVRPMIRDRVWPAPPQVSIDYVWAAGDPMPRLPTASILELDRAARALLRTSPWFVLEDSVGSATQSPDESRSPSLAPVVVDDGDGHQAVVPTTFPWSRAAAGLSGMVASALLLVGIWWSTIGSLSWSPSSTDLGVESPLTHGVRRASARARIDTPEVAAAAIGEAVSRASKACSLGAVTPDRLDIRVIVNRTGRVENAAVVGRRAGTSSAAECIRAMVLDSRIPPFRGDPIGVDRTVWVE